MVTRSVSFGGVVIAVLCVAVSASVGTAKLTAAQPKSAQEREQPSPNAAAKNVAPQPTEPNSTVNRSSSSSESPASLPLPSNTKHIPTSMLRGPTNDDENGDDQGALSATPSPVVDAAEAAERRSLEESDAILVTLGPVAFWLEYEATDEDRANLRFAQAIQSEVDRLTWEGETVKRELRYSTERSALMGLRRTRDAAMDRIPDLWANCWRSTLGFQRQAYWRPRAFQEAAAARQELATLDGDVSSLEAEWYVVPVEDEIFLTRALKRLRCTTMSRDTGNSLTAVTEVAGEGEGREQIDAKRDRDTSQGTIASPSQSTAIPTSPTAVPAFRLELEFGDAPGLLYPFLERTLVKEVPIALGHRFDHEATASDESEEDGAIDNDDAPDLWTPPTRILGTGTVVTFRVEHAEAAGRRVTPHLESFFALFASPELYQRLPMRKWLEIQARMNTLVDDLCESYHFCADRTVELAPLHSDDEHRLGEGPDHHVEFERWQSAIAAEAARLGEVKGVAER